MPSAHNSLFEPVASKSFWGERHTRFGHTGWADPVIYAYDQLERLSIIKAAILGRQQSGGLALDFGCGTGDFSKLLLGLGFTVCGYDPYVQPQIHSPQFTYAGTCADIPFGDKSLDLVLSVTVLDHILDDCLLNAALKSFHRLLKHGGIFSMMEYALDSNVERERLGLRNEYQAFRSLDEWQYLLDRHSFRILSVSPVPHPTFSPSPGYCAYARSNLVRLLRWASGAPMPLVWRDGILKRHAAKCMRGNSAKFGVDFTEVRLSPIKLIECTPT